MVRCTAEHGNEGKSGHRQGSESTQVKRIPDLNLPAENEKYYSKDQRAIRMGERIFELEKEKFANLDEAISVAKKRLTEKIRGYSADARARNKLLGVKTKDYHKPDYYKSRHRLRKQINANLKKENNTTLDLKKAEQSSKQIAKSGTSYRQMS